MGREEVAGPGGRRPGGGDGGSRRPEVAAALAEAGSPMALTSFPAPARWASRGTFGMWSWATLIRRLSEPDLWPGGGTIAFASARLPGWTFARFRDDSRVLVRDEAMSARETERRVVAVHGLVVEYDDEPTADADHLRQWWNRFAFVAHTTAFHEQPKGDKPEGPRWRVLIPFSRPVDLADAVRIGEWARHPRHDVGIVAEETLQPARCMEVPAIAPGGYKWTWNRGAPLEPDEALEELERWLEQDRALRAAASLEGCTLRDAVATFRARHASPILHASFGGAATAPVLEDAALQPGPEASLPALEGMIGPMWPGRVGVVVGAPGAGRSGLALQLAVQAAEAGHPVLLVLVRTAADEAVARLLAQQARGEVAASDLLRGGGSAEAVGSAAESLLERCPRMWMWAPTGRDRTTEALVSRVTAVADVMGHRPPLVVVDGVEGWGVGEVDVRVLAGDLRDIAHPGAIDPEWPGAAVLLVGAVPLEVRSLVLGTDALRESWDSGRCVTAGVLGPLEDDSALGVVLAVDRSQGEPVGALAAVVRNRHGASGLVPLQFDPIGGRFRPVG